MYAVTIVAGAIGEWTYYVLGSAIEVALLAAVVYYAWTLRDSTDGDPSDAKEATGRHRPAQR